MGVDMKLKLAEDPTNSKYWKIGMAWAEQQDWAYYKPDRFPAVKGIAEYLANQDGFTLFYSYVGREYEKVE